jgi:predicted DNA-binding transcriptional regulator AlpA
MTKTQISIDYLYRRGDEMDRNTMKPLLGQPQVLRMLGVTRSTFDKFKANLPGQVMVGARVKFREDVIIEFIESGGFRGMQYPASVTHNPTTQMGA